VGPLHRHLGADPGVAAGLSEPVRHLRAGRRAWRFQPGDLAGVTQPSAVFVIELA